MFILFVKVLAEQQVRDPCFNFLETPVFNSPTGQRSQATNLYYFKVFVIGGKQFIFGFGILISCFWFLFKFSFLFCKRPFSTALAALFCASTFLVACSSFFLYVFVAISSPYHGTVTRHGSKMREEVLKGTSGENIDVI